MRTEQEVLAEIHARRPSFSNVYERDAAERQIWLSWYEERERHAKVDKRRERADEARDLLAQGCSVSEVMARTGYSERHVRRLLRQLGNGDIGASI